MPRAATLRFVAPLLVALAAPLGSARAGSPPLSCRTAAEAAERAYGLPHHLLLAIGRAESGRPDPATGRLTPWPWSVNADGAGRFFASKAAALAFVRASAARYIDVGCFQVDLHYHGSDFLSRAAAFDPATNATVAAAFLARLHAETGSWRQAVARYHSADPASGNPYRRRVLSLWRGGPAIAGGAVDPVVVLLAPAARGVRVLTPGREMPAPRGGLPRVFSPFPAG
ncbi:MAG: transglycosylase SLT domain-containing protein [Acetobacteraceae bacterium]